MAIGLGRGLLLSQSLRQAVPLAGVARQRPASIQDGSHVEPPGTHDTDPGPPLCFVMGGRYTGGMTYHRSLLCLAVLAALASSAVWAAPPPITASSLNGTKADVMWAGIHKTITGNMRFVMERFAPGKRFDEGSREEQCLRKSLSEWHLNQIGGFMGGRDYSQEAVEIIRRFLKGGDDWCGPDESGRENEGLVTFRKFQASLNPAASRTLAEQVRARIAEMRDRPLTAVDVVGLVGAALLAPAVAAALAPL